MAILLFTLYIMSVDFGEAPLFKLTYDTARLKVKCISGAVNYYLYLSESWVEPVPHPVAKEIKRHDQKEYGHAGEERNPPGVV